MLEKRKRLRRAQDIQSVLAAGRRVSTRYYQVFVLPSDTPNTTPRVAVIVSRRAHASAVDRHRAQRKLRVMAQELISVYPQGYDMVVVAKAGAADQALSQLRSSLAPIKAILKDIS